MKKIFLFLLVLSSVANFGCNRSDVGGGDDEVQIERQEDYNREDATDEKTIPIKRDDELKIDTDEVDVND
jgi:hypothetical protein